jgi:hypothetical protein
VHTNVDRAIRETFGDRPLACTERLRGGSNKGVHRLTFTDGGTCVLYRWHAEESFWPADIALVEDVPGGSLEALLALDAAGGREALGGRWPRPPRAFRASPPPRPDRGTR